MQYSDIYNICQPIMDWLKEHYPHNHKIVIDTNGANLIEDGKMVVIDKDLKSAMFQKPFMPEGYEKEIQELLDVDTSEIKDDCHRFGVEMLQKLFDYENQPEPTKIEKEGKDE